MPSYALQSQAIGAAADADIAAAQKQASDNAAFLAEANQAIRDANSAKDLATAQLQRQLDVANQQIAAQAKPAAITSPSPLPPGTAITFDDAGLQLQLDHGGPVAAGVYKISKGVHARNAKTTYDLSQVTLQGAAKSITLLTVDADFVRFNRPTFDSIWPATLPSGKNMPVGVDAVLVKGSGCTIDHGHWRNIDVGNQLWPHAHILILIEPRFEPLECRRQNVYCGAGGQDESIERGDIFWLGGSGQSEQEHPVRCSTSGFSGMYVYGANLSAFAGKECFAFRQGHTAITNGVTFNGTYGTFLGENGPSSPACSDITICNCDFHISSDAAGNFAFIDVRAATDINVSSNYFWPLAGGKFAGQEAQIVTGNAQGVTVQNNTRYVPTLTPVGRKLRAIVDSPFVDDGSNKNVVGN